MAIPAPESAPSLENCPRIRPEIIFGPPLLSRGTTVYYMKDRATNWFYRIGVREYFLLSRMDGSRTLQQLSAEYAAQFGRQLNERSWQGLFQLMESRQLLSGASQSNLEALKRRATLRRRAEGRSLFRWRFALLNPDALLEKCVPSISFVFHPLFLCLALAAIVGLEIFVLRHLGAIMADLLATRTSSVIAPVTLLFVLLTLLFATCHEIAHGLACKRFGGSVPEMGIVWRYLAFFPYCSIDDVVLFHKRRHRISTACAGTFVNLLLLLPFGFCWALAPEGSILRDLSALALIILNVQVFFNLIPFLELDGYFMLSHALNMIDLRKEAHQFWLKGGKKLLLRKGVGIDDYARPARKLYLLYGLCSLLFTGVFLVGMGSLWFRSIGQWFGTPVALSGLLLSGLLSILSRLKLPGLAGQKQ